MSKKTLVIAFVLFCLTVLVSCDPSFISKVGTGLSKTGKPVFSTNVPEGDIAEISGILGVLANPSEDDDTALKEENLVNYVQKIKKTPSLLKKLDSELNEQITINKEIRELYLFMAKGLNYIGEVALNPAKEIAEKITALTEALTKDMPAEDISVLLTEFLGFEIDPETVAILKNVIPELVGEFTGDYIADKIVPYIEPYKELIKELNDAQEYLLESFEYGDSNKRLLACASVNEKLLNDIFTLIADLIPQEGAETTDNLVSNIGRLVLDLDTLTVLDSRIKFDSMNSLVDKFGL